MSDPTISDLHWKQIWETFHSEINIEIVHCLTEPVCPSAVVVIEHPRKVLRDTRVFGNTITEAAQLSYDRFVEKYLKEETENGY